MAIEPVIQKIVSGGQTGVDRAALDAAMAAGVAVGGWCPRGRRAADGRIEDRYPLRETPSSDYAQRTRWNVRDSDGTLVLLVGAPSGGTALTFEEARRLGRPCCVVRLDARPDVAAVRSWLERNGVQVLNVAGPREEEAPGIYALARGFMTRLLRPDPPR
ncbi:MAG: molybdenum cofactor carrier [Bacteroidetes bacterium]|nr:MAG: molybdenum cofactor carrier [Bacteroidota bacterium]